MFKPTVLANFISLTTQYARFLYLIIFSFFLLSNILPQILYAAIIVKKVSSDAEVEKMIWQEEGDRLNIQSADELKPGEVLPANCRICVSTGEVIIEKDGKEIKIGSGEYFDSQEESVEKDRTSYVKVAEGKVVYQAQFEHKGKLKPLGDSVPVDRGQVLLKRNECFSFEKMSIAKFEEFQAQQAEQKAQQEESTAPPELPGDNPGDEGEPPCVSPSC